jgi:hypothetical protein
MDDLDVIRIVAMDNIPANRIARRCGWGKRILREAGVVLEEAWRSSVRPRMKGRIDEEQ